ncbi:MAG: hypothetical protein HKN48_06415 [Flavobacteriaceae bacterium]|nr:hypothetical protein [Flavobacteriaceae bacterium]
MFTGFSQQELDYMGVIKINDTAIISYKISFVEKDGLVTGHSITDLAGPHETKSYISGYFDDENNSLEFYESGIIYTKSPIVEDDFCFVNFSGTLKKLNERQLIEGAFKGLYSNGEECISGEISLGGFGKILKSAQRMDKRIDRSLLISKEKKEMVNLTKSLDTLSMNIIARGETLNIFTKDKNVKLAIYDAGKEDGDRINLIVDGKIILENYTVTKKIKEIEIPVHSQKATIQVEAINVGTSAPNTVRIEITDSRNFVRTLTNLDEGETAGVTIINK